MTLNNEVSFEAEIIKLILAKKIEVAIENLSKCYGVAIPKIKVGMPKGRVKKVACYVRHTQTIHFSHQDTLHNPHIVLHEFYHHLRCHGGKHLGTEKNAEKFVQKFLRAYILTRKVAFEENDI